jgi:hypothetical protein
MVEPAVLDGVRHFFHALGLGSRDPGARTQGPGQVAEGSDGNPRGLGLHLHRSARLVDVPTGLQDQRKKLPRRSLGIGKLDVAGLGREQPRCPSRSLVAVS